MDTLAVAGLSARCMAEAAAGDGYGVAALDLFGDVDTRAACTRWFDIGEAAGMCIDEARLLQALGALARQGQSQTQGQTQGQGQGQGPGRVLGWVAGSGFDGRTDLLARGDRLLPLIGTAPDLVSHLRDPQVFFDFLCEHDIDHPPVVLPPSPGPGLGGQADARHDALASERRRGRWLLKDFGASGGWHIRRTMAPVPSLMPGQYLQREMPGTSMSATFVANGQASQLLGVNRQIVRAIGPSPFVYAGVLGPVPVPVAVLRRLQATMQTLTAGFALRGLASLDFLLEGDRVLVLEVNPRPPASLVLYPGWRPMAAHVRACLHGDLPAPPAATAGVRGQEIVYARQALQLDEARCRWLTAQNDTHDLPALAQPFAAGAPLCSVSASGSDAAAVLDQLRQRRESLLQFLESSS